MKPTIILLMLFSWLTAKAQDFVEMRYSKEKTEFRLFAPEGKRPVVRLYTDAADKKAKRRIALQRKEKNIYAATVEGDLRGLYYTFDIGQGECAGVFARAVGVNGKRGYIAPLEETNPEGWLEDKPLPMKKPNDMVIYEMHHRDFSIDSSASVRHKGKFLALTEPWAIRRLQRLGVTAVHILPSFDYASVDESEPERPQYNWGYDPLNYNVPEGSYSTNAGDPLCRIREFKQMVLALHKAGIRVILDVVYNHTFSVEGSNFQLTYPDYFYRKTKDGKYSDGSGCGNETASEKPAMRSFMLQSVLYWMREYHVDGFRFDLMGVHDIKTMNQIRRAAVDENSNVLVYGEGWSAGTCQLPEDQLAMKRNVKRLYGIAAFGDEMRDALRGPFQDDSKGAFLAGIAGAEESLAFGITGAVGHREVDMQKVNYSQEPWAEHPWQMISYVSCHDDMCLTDRLRASIPQITEEGVVDLSLLAHTAVLTSQGTPFILSGEEVLRSKKGIHNTFSSPDSVNAIHWDMEERYPEVAAYLAELIAIRKAHPILRLDTKEEVERHLHFLKKSDCTVAFQLKNHGEIEGETWREAIVILNSNLEPREIDIPEGNYRVILRKRLINQDGIVDISASKARCPARSAMILVKM